MYCVYVTLTSHQTYRKLVANVIQVSNKIITIKLNIDGKKINNDWMEQYNSTSIKWFLNNDKSNPKNCTVIRISNDLYFLKCTCTNHFDFIDCVKYKYMNVYGLNRLRCLIVWSIEWQNYLELKLIKHIVDYNFHGNYC